MFLDYKMDYSLSFLPLSPDQGKTNKKYCSSIGINVSLNLILREM
jgi:hypothetical protein